MSGPFDGASRAEDNRRLFESLPLSVPTPAYELLALALVVILGGATTVAVIAARRRRDGGGWGAAPDVPRLPLPPIHLKADADGAPTQTEPEELLGIDERTRELVNRGLREPSTPGR